MAQPDYSLPAWEQETADPAKFWLQGMQLGASIQHAKNQLDLQAQTTALETSVKQQQSQQSAMLEQEQLEQQHAYKTATLGLQQQELQQAQEKINLQTQQAAQQFLTQRAYQGEVQRLMQANPEMDEGTASMTAWLRTYGGQAKGGSGIAGVGKALATQAKLPQGVGQPQFFRDPNSGASLALGPKGHLIRTDTGLGRNQAGAFDKMDYQQLQRELTQLQKDQLDPMARFDKQGSAERGARIQAIQKQLQAIRGGMAGTATNTGAGEDFTQPTGQGRAPLRYDPASGSLVPTDGTDPTTNAAPAATPAPTRTAPAPASIPSIPGISDEKPTSQRELRQQAVKEKAAKAASDYQQSVIKNQREYAQGIAKEKAQTAYNQAKATAQNLYAGLKNYAANPDITYKTEETYQQQRAQLASLLSKLTDEDRMAITGEKAEPSGYDTEGQ